MPVQKIGSAPTSAPAEIFGIPDRGRLAPGLAADITIFDPRAIACHEEEIVNDMPDGGPRYVARASGIQWSFVNGRPIRGAQPASSFREVIDEELARAAALSRRGVAPRDLYRAAVADGDEQGTLGEVDEFARVAAAPESTRYRMHIDPARTRGADLPLECSRDQNVALHVPERLGIHRFGVLEAGHAAGLAHMRHQRCEVEPARIGDGAGVVLCRHDLRSGAMEQLGG